MSNDNRVMQVVIRARDEMSATVGRARGAIEQFNKEIGNGHVLISAATRNIGAMAAAYLGLNKLGGLAKSFINVNSEMEDAKTLLRTLYGEAERAAEVFELLKKNAETMPFDFTEVRDAGITLKRFGMEMEDWLKPAEDLAAFMGGDLRAAAAALGRAYAGGAGAADIFREKGILNVVKDFRKIDDLTKLTLPEFRRAMYETFTQNEMIVGGTDRLAKNWKGMVSNLTDIWGQFQVAVGDSGLFERLGEELREFLTAATKAAESGELERRAAAVSRFFEQAIDHAKKFYVAVVKAFKFLDENKALVKLAVELWAVSKVVHIIVPLVATLSDGVLKTAQGFFTAEGRARGFVESLNAKNIMNFTTVLAASTLAVWEAFKAWKAMREEQDKAAAVAGDTNRLRRHLTERIGRAELLQRDTRGVKGDALRQKLGLTEEELDKARKIYTDMQGLVTLYRKGKETPDQAAERARRETGIILTGGGDAIREMDRISKYIEEEFKKRGEVLIAAPKPKSAAGKEKPKSGEVDFGATPGGKGQADKLLDEVKRLNAREIGERLKHYDALLATAREQGESTVAIERMIAAEKEEILKRTAERYEAWGTAWTKKDEAMSARKRELSAMEAEATLGEFELRRWQAERELKEDEEKYGRKRAARLKYKAAMAKIDEDEEAARRSAERAREDVILSAGSEFDRRRAAAKRYHTENVALYEGDAVAIAAVNRVLAATLEEIDREEKEAKMAAAGAFRKFNLAQLQAMLEDERATQQERYLIQAEINARIAADEVSAADARRMGLRQAMEEFQSSSQVWMDYGRQTAVSLKESFSGIFAATFKGEIRTLGDLWQNLCARMRDNFINALAEMAANKALSKLFGESESDSGGGGIGSALSAIGGLFKKSGGSSGAISALASTIGFAAEGAVFRGALRPIAAFANGGIVSRPTLAVVGEGAGPEAVIPLRGGAVPVRFTGGGQYGGGVTQHVTIQLNAMDAASFNEYLSREGGSTIAQYVQRLAPGAVADDIRSGGQMRALTRR